VRGLVVTRIAGVAETETESGCIADVPRFRAAIARIDEENSRDPQTEVVEGVQRPRELVYSEWLTEWVLRLQPGASEVLRLAARSQHIRRWEIPRASYPQTREGYLRWRSDLKQMHARISGELLRRVGYSEEVVARVQALNLKRELKQDPECQVLEDALCLVFLEHQSAALAAKASDEKMIGALRKAWAKMSASGRAAARELTLEPRVRALLLKALED